MLPNGGLNWDLLDFITNGLLKNKCMAPSQASWEVLLSSPLWFWSKHKKHMSRKISLKGAQVDPEIAHISTCDLFHGESWVAVPEGTQHPMLAHVSNF